MFIPNVTYEFKIVNMNCVALNHTAIQCYTLRPSTYIGAKKGVSASLSFSLLVPRTTSGKVGFIVGRVLRQVGAFFPSLEINLPAPRSG